MNKRITTALVVVLLVSMALALGPVQAQEPSPDTAGVWIIYPDSTPDHWVGNDRHATTFGNPDIDHYTSIHGALGYSGRYLCPGPNNDDICYWEFYNPPPEGSIIELRGPGVWEIGGDAAQGGMGREKQKSLVVQQNGITIHGQDYDDGTVTRVQQEIFFNNGATTALFYLEASDLTIENLHISGTWPSNSSGYALAIGRYTLIGPDANATGLTVTGNTFNNLRAMFDQAPTVAHLTVVDNYVEDTYYNLFKYGVTLIGDTFVAGNSFNHVGEGKSYPALGIYDNTGAVCIDFNTFNGWRSGHYAIEVYDALATPIGIGENNVFVDQVGGSGAGYELYPLTDGSHAVGAPTEDDVIPCSAGANEPPVADPNGPYLGAVAPDGILFDGAASSDPDNDPLTYAWTFGDGNTGTDATPTHSYALADIYDVCLTVNDGTVDSEEVCTIAVVYDPAGGFVTGGGWIYSEPGAYVSALSLEGKATFGFVSKYKKGASVPSGNTEFQFKAGSLNFHSSSYDWLVVNKHEARAQFKGMGTINGEGEYKFMLRAGDGDPDTFRIKIWYEDGETEVAVYDNGYEESGYETGQPIGGGSIVIHTKGK